MTIINCPHCANQIQVEESWNGMQIDCPICNQPFIINILPVQNCPTPASMAPGMPNIAYQQPPPLRQSMWNEMWTQSQKYIFTSEEKSKEIAFITLLVAWFLLTQCASIAHFLSLITKSLFKFDILLIILTILGGISGLLSLLISIKIRYKFVIYASAAVLSSLIIPIINSILKNL